ncbi:Long-chain fatty acid transport protein 4, partial [Orchesella cincta]
GSKRLVCLQAVCIYTKLRNRTVFQVFDNTANKYPKKVCFYFEDEAWTFRQVQEYANRIANYFSKEGYKKGDKIAFIMENRPEYVATWLGLSKIGVIPSLININLREESLKHALELLPHKGIIYEEQLASDALKEAINLGYKPLQLFCALKTSTSSNITRLVNSIDLESELKKVSPKFESDKHERINFDDPLYYSFTSGTTGFPKAAIIKHSRFLFAGLSPIHIMGVKHSDIQYTPLPLYHTTAGMLGLGSALFNGTSIVLRKKFSASQFWKDCIKYNVTVAQYIGETLRYLYSQPPSEYDKKHKVRKLFGLGLRHDLWHDFVSRFAISDIKELYGSTEGNCNMANLDGKQGSCGFIPRWAAPFMPYKLAKVTEEGEVIRDPKTGKVLLCGVNEPGELIGKIYPRDPLRNFEGYSDKASTEKKILRDVQRKGDSFFRSGDLLMMDEFGYFYFKDRSGDTFRWKGENVSTQQVELVISKICDMTDVAVYGVKIPFTEGRAGMAAVVDPENKIDLKQFASEIIKRLPGYSRPLFIRRMSKLEFTGTHKIKKADLQKEGFDIRVTNDRIYFLSVNEYVPLTEDLYNSILNGNVRL